MIVVKDLRVDVLGEPLFEKVNLVIRSGERIAMLGSKAADVSTFLRILAGEEEMDSGTVTTEGERVAYVPAETLQGGTDSLARIHHGRPTFLLIDAAALDASGGSMAEITRFIQGFRGGMLIASNNASLMQAARVTKVFELHAATKSVSTYTGSYDEYLVEREKNRVRLAEAYEKQQKEKRRIEDWLVQKRKEAANDRSPEKGATIRTKAKYLQREILDKEIPNPNQPE